MWDFYFSNSNFYDDFQSEFHFLNNMTAETKYQSITQFATKIIKIIILNSKIFYKNHKNYNLQSKIGSNNRNNYY